MEVDEIHTEDLNGSQMKRAVNYYEQGQISRCIATLTEMPNSNVNSINFEHRNNLSVSKFQQSFLTDDIQLRNSATDDILNVWLAVFCIPLTSPQIVNINQLTLVSASNALYCIIANHGYLKNHDRIHQIASQALERFSARHDLYCLKPCSPQEKFILLLEMLINCQRLDETEISIILYICVLVLLYEEDDNLRRIVEQILKSHTVIRHRYKIDDQEGLSDNYFLLSPLEIPLITNCSNFNATIFEIASLLPLISSCKKGQNDVSVRSVKHNKLIGLFEFMKLFTKFQLNETEKDQFGPYEGEYLIFATNLLEAVQFAKKGQHSLAIKQCSFAISGTVGRTNLCSIPLMFTALQFKALGERDFEIETLKVAEDSLLHGPPMECSFHLEPIAFLLGKMNFLKIPSLFMIRHHLGQAFLENQEYEKSVTEYRKLQDDNYRGEWSWNSASLSQPDPSVIVREHALALLLSHQFHMALQVVDSFAQEDFLFLFLRAEIAAAKEQFHQSVQFLNQAVCQIHRCELYSEKIRDILASKLHWRSSQMFQKCGNTKDAFFQLRLALELCPHDSKLIDYNIECAKQLAIVVHLPHISVQEETKMLDPVNQFLSVQKDLSVKYLINICDVESVKLEM